MMELQTKEQGPLRKKRSTRETRMKAIEVAAMHHRALLNFVTHRRPARLLIRTVSAEIAVLGLHALLKKSIRKCDFLLRSKDNHGLVRPKELLIAKIVPLPALLICNSMLYFI